VIARAGARSEDKYSEDDRFPSMSHVRPTDGGSADRPPWSDHTAPGGPRRSRSEPREARPAAFAGGRQPQACGRASCSRLLGSGV